MPPAWGTASGQRSIHSFFLDPTEPSAAAATTTSPATPPPPSLVTGPLPDEVAKSVTVVTHGDGHIAVAVSYGGGSTGGGAHHSPPLGLRVRGASSGAGAACDDEENDGDDGDGDGVEGERGELRVPTRASLSVSVSAPVGASTLPMWQQPQQPERRPVTTYHRKRRRGDRSDPDLIVAAVSLAGGAAAAPGPTPDSNSYDEQRQAGGRGNAEAKGRGGADVGGGREDAAGGAGTAVDDAPIVKCLRYAGVSTASAANASAAATAMLTVQRQPHHQRVEQPHGGGDGEGRHEAMASRERTTTATTTVAAMTSNPANGSNMKQLFLDLGQKNFGHVTCATCGLLYARGEAADERTHAAFHAQTVAAAGAVIAHAGTSSSSAANAANACNAKQNAAAATKANAGANARSGVLSSCGRGGGASAGQTARDRSPWTSASTIGETVVVGGGIQCPKGWGAEGAAWTHSSGDRWVLAAAASDHPKRWAKARAIATTVAEALGLPDDWLLQSKSVRVFIYIARGGVTAGYTTGEQCRPGVAVGEGDRVVGALFAEPIRRAHRTLPSITNGGGGGEGGGNWGIDVRQHDVRGERVTQASGFVGNTATENCSDGGDGGDGGDDTSQPHARAHHDSAQRSMPRHTGTQSSGDTENGTQRGVLLRGDDFGGAPARCTRLTL